jgi:hypothetical protein
MKYIFCFVSLCPTSKMICISLFVVFWILCDGFAILIVGGIYHGSPKECSLRGWSRISSLEVRGLGQLGRQMATNGPPGKDVGVLPPRQLKDTPKVVSFKVGCRRDRKFEGTRNTRFRQVRTTESVIPYVLCGLYCLRWWSDDLLGFSPFGGGSCPPLYSPGGQIYMEVLTGYKPRSPTQVLLE